MGMEQSVSFTGKTIPSFTAVRDLLAQRGYPVEMRMIDGQLASPDELPGADWRELRLSLAPGMITVRREPDRLRFVIWGNADAALQQARNELARAFAEVGDGVLESGTADD
jgi:hypothetical protein